ncbi:hypothetical protein KsCSTR_19680 [Candidatus Kuenenia stuttgartiensis]|uniref:Uncharacterized protein n=1 Tax=Kuenenia stuttgartiensis TaxID=174633 RepID=A0A6G7GQ78_KUEST|nr:hypothetical protein KsCSTR_19680 [Candidatus Kuenenia stuttgartiensis]
MCQTRIFDKDNRIISHDNDNTFRTLYRHSLSQPAINLFYEFIRWIKR